MALPRVWLGVLGVSLGSFMAALDVGVTQASFQQIQGTLGASLEEANWISMSYRVAELITIVMTPWLSRGLSAKTYVLIANFVFVLCSVGCGSADDLTSIVIWRSLQGLSGGALMPMALQVVLTELPKTDRPAGFAIIGVVTSFAPTIAPALGGWIAESLGWQYIFFVNVIPCLVMALAVMYGLPKRSACPQELANGDWLGLLSFAIAAGCLEFVLEEGDRLCWFGSEVIVCLSIIGCVFFAACISIELSSKKPATNLHLLKTRSFALATSIAFVVAGVVASSFYALPLYLVVIQDYSPANIGNTLVWSGLPQLIFVPFVPFLMKRFKSRFLILLGCILVSISMFLQSQITADTGTDQLIVPQVVRAFGQPLIAINLCACAMAKIRESHAGDASALYSLIKNMGSSIGLGLCSTFLTWRQHLHAVRLSSLVTSTNPVAITLIGHFEKYFLNFNGDTINVHTRALAEIYRLTARQAFILAVDDFFVIGSWTIFVLGIVAVLFLREDPAVIAASAIHKNALQSEEV